MSRAGSPAYWVPRLAAHPSVHTTADLTGAPGPHETHANQDSKSPALRESARKTSSCSSVEAYSSPPSYIQAGAKALGIAHLRCCEGRSYSGPIRIQPNVTVRALHCNGLHPNPPTGFQEVIYLMTCSPLSTPEDLKVLIKEGISRLCTSDQVQASYEALRFFAAPGDPGTTGLHLLIGLQTSMEVHMKLRDVLLTQPDYSPESPVTTSPWLEPPFAAPSIPPTLGTPLNQRTPGEIADLLKARFRPAPSGAKKPKEMRWITTSLTSDPTEDTLPKYSDWEASASLYVAVDILTHHDGVRHSGFEGQSSATARGLLVLATCRIQQLLQDPPPNHELDLESLTELADSLSFNDIRKRTLQSRFCSVLCETTSDQDALLNCGGLVIPFGHMSLFVSFAPSMDDTLRTSLPKEVRIALRSHKALFYSGGLTLVVTSSIPLIPAALFQLALLTLLSLHQGDMVPTPTERPRVVSDVIADVTPQGHAPWLARLIKQSPVDTADGYRPLPWLTPSLVKGDDDLAWTSSGNLRSIKRNTTLSFCPGAVIDGQPQPFIVVAGEVTSSLCSSIIVSLSCPRVFHSALHTGSNSMKDFGLHTFPKSVLQQLEAAETAEWMASFRPPSPAHLGEAPLMPLPKNLSLRFGAHRASIYSTTKAAKTAALTTSAKDATRESHARELTGKHPRPKILDEEFQDYQALLDNAEVEPMPLTLPDLPPPRPAPSVSGQKRGNTSREGDETEDTGTSTGGVQPVAPMTREEAMAAFIAAPFIPPIEEFRVDHITVLLALLLEDPIRSTAIGLIIKGYSLVDAEIIWSQWEPHLQLPPSHPLAGPGHVERQIMAMLQAVYTTPETATQDILGLTDLVSVAIPVETFILFTDLTLHEEDMVRQTSPHSPLTSVCVPSPTLTPGTPATHALSGYLIGPRHKVPQRPPSCCCRGTLDLVSLRPQTTHSLPTFSSTRGLRSHLNTLPFHHRRSLHPSGLYLSGYPSLAPSKNSLTPVVPYGPPALHGVNSVSTLAPIALSPKAGIKTPLSGGGYPSTRGETDSTVEDTEENSSLTPPPPPFPLLRNGPNSSSLLLMRNSPHTHYYTATAHALPAGMSLGWVFSAPLKYTTTFTASGKAVLKSKTVWKEC